MKYPNMGYFILEYNPPDAISGGGGGGGGMKYPVTSVHWDSERNILVSSPICAPVSLALKTL